MTHVPVQSETPGTDPLFGLAESVRISRDGLFGGLVIIAFANGIIDLVFQELAAGGVILAVLNTFGISAFVWAALIASIVLLRRARPARADALDLLVAAFATAAILLPAPTASWLAITAMAIYLLVRPGGSSELGRAGAILLAMTIPMIWSRILMNLFSDVVLAIDASMVSWIVGTSRTGNLVPFADGSGALWIAPDCSSLSNVSLAILFSVMIMNFSGRRWTTKSLLVVLGTILAVIVINVVRIGLIGLYPTDFALIHGEVGATVARWLSTIAIVAISYYGTKRYAPVAG